jgi:hypothetical protein
LTASGGRAGSPDLLPEIVLDQARIDLAFENRSQQLPLRIVVNAGELDG